MKSFTVVYQFPCSNCKHIAVGKKVFQANSAEEASHLLPTIELACRICHRSVTTEAVATTSVFESTDQDLVESSTDPDVPRA
jgi:hypothetical protein